ncbi:MAG: PCRF domain-containing protein, partial [Planctomycetota bacterium]
MEVTPEIRENIRAIANERDELANQLNDPDVLADHRRVRDLSIKKAALDPVADGWHRFIALEQEAADLRAVIKAAEDPELTEMARAELPEIESQAAELIDQLLADLVTSDDRAIASVMLELRAGVGGDEAGIWAADLLSMYEKLARRRGWTIETLSADTDDSVEGLRSATINIKGEAVFSDLAHEAGTHCVKRVPATETQGRVHTSTATVAVLPEPEEVEVTIDPADVDEHITTAQGPGGQNVNKVATAVHLIHKPTGVEVRMQETKSQAQNREKAWRLLRARVFEIEREKARAAEAAARNQQIGTAGRAERIRTYRYKDSIAVDHRINESFPLQQVLAGEMDALIESLRANFIAETLAQ